jgi:ketosteroid isomerase-like protein
MSAKTPEEICTLFKRFMRIADIDSLLVEVYDPEVVFLSESRDLLKGRDGLRKILAPLAAGKPNFYFKILQIIQSGDIALMHTEWVVSGRESRQHAIEVARRQADGTWRWLIGDPFTVDREIGARREAA